MQLLKKFRLLDNVYAMNNNRINIHLIRIIAISLICMLYNHSDISAQQENILVSGKVTDSKGEPLPGVSVSVKNTTRGVTTDYEGNYRIELPPSRNTLVFSFLGMETQEMTVEKSRELNVSLTETAQALDEVVVTGYQTVDKRTFTGSVGKVKSEKLQQAGVADVGKMLKGTVAGVSVEDVSGTFGVPPKIRIRGNSSISGTQEPLWVLDGVVLDDPVDLNPNDLYSGDPASVLSSAISGINPNDIAEIEILKDASATAMYGTQAVNGVIVITTKTGKKGDFNVNYNGNYSLTMKPSITQFNVMNSKERMEFSEELYDKNLMDFVILNQSYGAYGKLLEDLSRKEITWRQFDSLTRQYKLHNTDWFDVLFKNAFIQEHSLSVSSGSEKALYYFSGSYYDDKGQTKGQFAKRYTANIRTKFNVSDRFSFGVILNGSVRDQRLFGTFEQEETNGSFSREFDINPYKYARSTSRAMRPFNENGDYEYYRRNYAPFNILDELKNNFINVKGTDIKAQADLQYKILPNLEYHGLYSARYTNTYNEHIITENSNVSKSYRAMGSSEIINRNQKLYDDPDDEDQNPVSVLPRGGIITSEDNLGSFFTIRNSVSWKPRIGKDHFFDILAGTEFRNKNYNYKYTKGYGYEYFKGNIASPDYRAIKRDMLIDGESYYDIWDKVYSDLAFYSNMTYTYKSKYNATLSLRSDGSNRLGKSQRFRFLPIWVVGFSWNLDQEPFISGITSINSLKIRTSYGLRGNVGGLVSPALLAYYDLTSRFEGNNNENIIHIYAPENPDLQWEKEKMFNLALEFALFDRINGVLEYYIRNNYDILNQVEVSRVSGFLSKYVNWADMKNEGYEFTLGVDMLRTSKFSWNTLFTFGYNRNKILNAHFEPTVMQATVSTGAAFVGKPRYGLYSFRYAGLNNEGLPLFYDENGEESMTINRFSRETDMLKYEGSREPLGSGGFTNTISYGPFQLSVLFTYSFGNKIRLNPLVSYYYNDTQALNKELSNRWQLPGDEQYTNIPRIIDNQTKDELQAGNADPFVYYNRSDLRVADGSHVRLRNVTLTYDIPFLILQKAGIQNAKVELQGQNLYLRADPRLNGQDPEALISGVNVPSPTVYSMGIKIQF
jgi:TonB-linked SusC/RagA family outer membrane protein